MNGNDYEDEEHFYRSHEQGEVALPLQSSRDLEWFLPGSLIRVSFCRGSFLFRVLNMKKLGPEKDPSVTPADVGVVLTRVGKLGERLAKSRYLPPGFPFPGSYFQKTGSETGPPSPGFRGGMRGCTHTHAWEA